MNIRYFDPAASLAFKTINGAPCTVFCQSSGFVFAGAVVLPLLGANLVIIGNESFAENFIDSSFVTSLRNDSGAVLQLGFSLNRDSLSCILAGFCTESEALCRRGRHQHCQKTSQKAFAFSEHFA